MTKNAWLLILFVLYLTGIPVFAIIYFRLYRRTSSSFVFASDIRDSRLAKVKTETDQFIRSLEVLETYLAAFTSERSKNLVKVDDEVDRFVAVLKDGRRIMVERQIHHSQPHGGDSELLPYVELRRSDKSLEWTGRVQGHGFISDYSMIEEFLENTAKGISSDISKAKENRNQLETKGARVWTFTDFLYFSTITQSTVGYGDILPNETNVRAVVICQIIFAYAILILGLNVVLALGSF